MAATCLCVGIHHKDKRSQRNYQSAENGGLDPSWLDVAFLGHPDFLSGGPKTLTNKYFGTSGLKIGAPQKRENQPRQNPPFSAL